MGDDPERACFVYDEGPIANIDEKFITLSSLNFLSVRVPLIMQMNMIRKVGQLL
jgi:hypothetical protein